MASFKISLIMVFFMATAIVNAQQVPMTLGYVKMALLRPSELKAGFTSYKTTPTIFKVNTTDSSKIRFSPNNLSSTYYTEHLGMMCKEELKLEKVIKFPVKIRLGSKDQVDYLEGKNYSH